MSMAAGDHAGDRQPEPAGSDHADASAGGFGSEWPAKAADLVDLLVDTVHDKALRPAVLVARAVVFGILIAVLCTVVLVLVSVGLLRLLDVYAFPGQVWLSYVVLGGVFTLAGMVAWTKRTARRPAAATAE